MLSLFKSRLVLASALGVSVSALATATPVMAQTQVRQFDIPAQALASSLLEFSRQSDIMVVVAPDLAAGRTAPALRGRYASEEAIARLLRGSGLRAVANARGGYRIERADSAPSATRQDAATTPGSSGEGIVVTGSRIDLPGYESPTPLLRMTQSDLQVVSRPNLGAAFADLPQFKAAESPVTSSTNTGAGRFPINIRGLGAQRSLLLMDGRRLVDGDLNSVPSIMIANVDVVTGGASAAWGSDAVAGVVNLIVDGDYEGVRLGAHGGISSRGDAQEYGFSGKFGTRFADGRGHFVIGGEYVDNKGIPRRTDRANTGRWSSLGNTTLTPDIGYATRLKGGYITSGVLQGQGFNPDGTLRTPDIGTVIGSNMIGGEGPSNDDYSVLVTPQRRYAIMGKASYELTDTLEISADLRYSRFYNSYAWFGSHIDNWTIQADNAFLNNDIRQALAAAGQDSFTLSRFNGDLAFADIDVDRRNIQGTIALDGSFGDGRWRYGAYYSHGEYRNKLRTPGFLIAENFANAVDAVIDPATGAPVCRVQLTQGDSGCVPLNLFGEGAPSQAAINYTTGTPRFNGLDKLDTYGASLRGEPVDLPAGPVSIAVGVEGRRLSTRADISEMDAAGAFRTFNFSGFSGSYNVKEAFAEVVLPLVHDTPLLRNLQLNGAVRASDYSTSGTIWSWKLGLTNEFFPGVIGRVTRSRDIRAPNLTELYTTPTMSYGGIVDPRNPDAGTTSTLIYGGGNPQLQPELANTWTAGLTMAPLPSLTASIDYFNIAINDVISTLGGQNIVDRCEAGNTNLCGYINRDSAGRITSITSSQVNLAQFKTDGIDAEVAYSLPLNNSANGRIDVRLIGTWVNSFTRDDDITKIEYVKTQGYAFTDGTPRLRANLSVGYASDGFSGLVRGRFISAGYWDRTRPTLTNNDYAAFMYFDLNLSQKVAVAGGKSLEIYGNVANLFDKDPPIYSTFTPYYDVIGRYMTIGARLEF
ncbi:TonB-dependent receptor [Novosphingobium sp. MBES04]|uniref:TonB-dependent receptor n=1 Tax=Novosphingobium sp. MBES04 TaxID=1206458 RepID=UPI000723835B|nr:TonB-dependent receptor [Novosphingobium sp. MBES04]GAM05021.1 TonB-dependent receptor-like protein [Novosphingobium sp. MBES04]